MKKADIEYNPEHFFSAALNGTDRISASQY
jgi:hypothetical protein